MDTSQILADLRAERDRINQAITALESLNSTGTITARRGRPPAAMTQGAAPKASGRRRMSLAARKRISEAAKKRWAQRKGMSSKPQGNAKQSAAKKVALKRAKGGISAAGRKRISEMMKKRWAERKRAAKTA